ncbi:MAG TPA: hypothetical protein VHM02_12090, partial [Thermoanaerobaculia bacterium]|nr:hypothetical protein [Thermoanaerobaculia bacterium]
EALPPLRPPGRGDASPAQLRAGRAPPRRRGRGQRRDGGPAPARARLLATILATLTAHGYEPERTGGAVRLRNCPFHGLVGDHKQLVCGMNLALLEGVIAGLALPGATAALDPHPGLCCVRLDLEPA